MPERIPPHNLDAERSVLGAAMLSRDALADVSELIRPEDFYDSVNKEIYSTIWEMFKAGKSIDLVTVCDELKKRGSLEACGGRSFIAELTGNVPTISNAAEYAKIVAETATLRQLILSAEMLSILMLILRTASRLSISPNLLLQRFNWEVK